MNSNMNFRIATKDDIGVIMRFIVELAEYEKLGHTVTATEELIKKWVFERKMAEVVIASADGDDVGFALFYHNFSTIVGKAGIHLEDLYVRPEYRGKGYGKAMLAYVASLAVERDCGRLEWWCLDWNKPSIDFYLALGASQMSEWTTYRLDGDDLRRVAEHAKKV